jgi:hypothetical protein
MVRKEAAKARFTILIEKSYNSSDRRKKYFVLGCKRSGVYKRKENELKARRHNNKEM